MNHRRQIRELLDTFELTDLASRKPAQLSGGQKQRAALARILITSPQLLLLDEPTRGLDPRLRESFYQLLQQTQQRLQIPALLITHDIEECLRIADFVCLMRDGRILQSGDRQSVLDRPATPEVARTLSIFNLLPAEVLRLDPAKRTSRLRVSADGKQQGSTEIAGPHLRGHLIGDHGTICFLISETQVFPPDDAQGEGGLVLPVLEATPSSQGVRLRFAEDLLATVQGSRWEVLRQCAALRVVIPPAAISFLG